MSLAENTAATAPLSDEVLDLRASIESSKSEIASQAVNFEKPKKKGGRPPGARDKAPRKRPIGDSPVIATAPENPQVPPAPIGPIEPGPAVPIIAVGAKVPFQMAAAKTGCSEVVLSDEEAVAIAIEVDKCLQLYMPDLQMDPRRAALVSAGLAIGGVAISKYMIYSKFVDEQRKTIEKAREDGTPDKPFPTETVGEKQPQDAIAPADFFSRAHFQAKAF